MLSTRHPVHYQGLSPLATEHAFTHVLRPRPLNREESFPEDFNLSPMLSRVSTDACRGLSTTTSITLAHSLKAVNTFLRIFVDRGGIEPPSCESCLCRLRDLVGSCPTPLAGRVGVGFRLPSGPPLGLGPRTVYAVLDVKAPAAP